MKTQQNFFCNFFRNNWGQTLRTLAIGLGFCLISCTDKKPSSAILILVDQFKVSDLRCSQEQMSDNSLDKRGFEVLCEDFVRFTHAYTPSTLELPTIASILTGMYPYEHQLRDNSQALSRKTVTLPEELSRHGYKTFFISAGLPVLRKSGLHQGFDIFDDAISTQVSHRSAEEVLRKALLYFRDIPQNKPFLFAIHLQDLGYPYSKRNSEPLSYEERSMFGAMDNLSDELGSFFSELKRVQKWNDTLIVVAGLRGRSDVDRPQKISALNLHSENTQVALFIKPPNKPQDEMQNWKVDHNVSLADLGPTLSDYLLDAVPNTSIEKQSSLSLKPALLNEKKSDEFERRTVIIETGYPSWRLNEKPEFAYINSNYLYIHSTSKQLYNLRTDSFELTPISSASPKTEDAPESWISQAINQTQAVAFDESKTFQLFPEELYEDTLLWSHSDNDRDVISRLSRYCRKPHSQTHPRYRKWLLYLLLNQRKWHEVYELSNNEYLSFVALLNLEFSANEEKKKNNRSFRNQITLLTKSNPCLRLILDLYNRQSSLDATLLERCSDDKLKISLQYLFADQFGLHKDSVRKRIENKLRSQIVFRRYALLNENKQLEFDLDIGHSHLLEPFETVLYLPTVNRLRIELLNNLITKDNRLED